MTITLRFVTARGVASDLIQRGQLGVRFPTHVEWKMPDGRLLGAHLDGGVQIRAPDYDAATWETQHFVAVPCSDEQLAAATVWLDQKVGKPYDVRAIEALGVGAFLDKDETWRTPDSWFCSDLIAMMMEAVGIIQPLPIDTTHVTPLMAYCVCAAITPNFGKPEQH